MTEMNTNLLPIEIQKTISPHPLIHLHTGAMKTIIPGNEKLVCSHSMVPKIWWMMENLIFFFSRDFLSLHQNLAYTRSAHLYERSISISSQKFKCSQNHLHKLANWVIMCSLWKIIFPIMRSPLSFQEKKCCGIIVLPTDNKIRKTLPSIVYIPNMWPSSYQLKRMC